MEEAFGYWGLCPECKSEPEVLNIGCDHWMICSAHKFKWCIGSNLFSAWRHEDERIWSENREKLADFVEVLPYHPDAEGGEPGAVVVEPANFIDGGRQCDICGVAHERKQFLGKCWQDIGPSQEGPGRDYWPIYVCRDCVETAQHGASCYVDIDQRLKHHAARLEFKAKMTRELIGKLRLPTSGDGWPPLGKPVDCIRADGPDDLPF